MSICKRPSDSYNYPYFLHHSFHIELDYFSCLSIYQKMQHFTEAFITFNLLISLFFNRVMVFVIHLQVPRFTRKGPALIYRGADLEWFPWPSWESLQIYTRAQKKQSLASYFLNWNTLLIITFSM